MFRYGDGYEAPFLTAPYKFPFELVATAITEKIYRGEMTRFLCLWLRLSRLPRGNVAAITGRALNESQALALNEIWSDDIWGSKVTNEASHGLMERSVATVKHVDVTAMAKLGKKRKRHFEEDEGCEDDEDDEEQEEADVEERTNEAVSSMPNCDPAADLTLRLFYYAATEEFKDSRSSSSLLVYFSATRGLSTLDGADFLVLIDSRRCSPG